MRPKPLMPTFATISARMSRFVLFFVAAYLDDHVCFWKVCSAIEMR